jgi:hypothetical protein
MPLDQQTAAERLHPRSSPQSMPVRAQLLATEHWSLLAARGMTWSEVMSRITVHLTVSSAALVVLALVTQTQGLGGAFHVLAIALASVILALGTLTGVRVHNASREDAAIVLGMNRLRAAYLTIDPGIADYLVTSPHDDQAGLMATYTMGMPRSAISHVIGSTSMFVNILNAIVAGALGALIADAAQAGPMVTALSAVVSGAGYLAAVVESARRSFAQPPMDSRFPTRGPG